MQPQVRSNSTVVIGYCFGAAAVLDLAASWPDPITDNVLGVLLQVLVPALHCRQAMSSPFGEADSGALPCSMSYHADTAGRDATLAVLRTGVLEPCVIHLIYACMS